MEHFSLYPADPDLEILKIIENYIEEELKRNNKWNDINFYAWMCIKKNGECVENHTYKWYGPGLINFLKGMINDKSTDFFAMHATSCLTLDEAVKQQEMYDKREEEICKKYFKDTEMLSESLNINFESYQKDILELSPSNIWLGDSKNKKGKFSIICSDTILWGLLPLIKTHMKKNIINK